MSTKTASRLLLAALAAASLLLTGCEPGDTTGAPSGGCDPHGFGPFSGCGDKGATAQTVQPVSGKCDPHGFGPLSGCNGAQRDETTRDDTAGDSQGFTPDWMANTARHEAGHKAVADEYGWGLLDIVVRPDGSGETRPFALLAKDPQQQLTFYYAGVIACGDESTGYGTASTKGDFDYAEQILDHYDADRADQMEAAARADAERIVTKRSAQIHRDAAQLLKDGRLG